MGDQAFWEDALRDSDQAIKPDTNQNNKEKVNSTQVIKRKIIRQPRPKLDSDRLTSEKGLRALLDECRKIRYRKASSYRNNLDLLLSTYEHWAHRLYPKLPFDEVVEKIEILGSKKTVQHALSLLRIGKADQYDLMPGAMIDHDSDGEPNVNEKSIITSEALELDDNNLLSYTNNSNKENEEQSET